MSAPDVWSLADLATPWCLHVAVTLDVAEHVAAGKGEISALARVCGAHAGSLERVLRHLVEKGVFEEPETGRFALNDAARSLMDPGMRLGFDLHSMGGRMAHSWSTLLQAVQTGEPAYHTVFGKAYWEDLTAHPKIAADFDALMGPAGHGTPDPDVLMHGDWDTVRSVVDVGGGTGALLAEVLKAHPTIRGMLVDLPNTVARAPALFRAAGVADRVTAVAQSFFDPLPAGADLYLLKSVLSDWPDKEAEALLRRCREAAAPQGRIVIVNGVSPDDVRPCPDLLMLVLVGGKERRLSEFRQLAASAGLRVTSAGKNKAGRFMVECKPLQ